LIADLLTGWPLELPDPAHARHCAVLADSLFAGLHETLGLKPTHRRLAVAGALFHDVGYLRSARDHHRKAFDLLREADLPGLDIHQRLIVACAARYHGGTYPNIEHAGFGEMTTADQRVVRRIAALVRLAAALDASHLGVIDRVEASSHGDRAVVVAFSRGDAPVESDRLREAEGAFMALTQMSLRTNVISTT